MERNDIFKGIGIVLVLFVLIFLANEFEIFGTRFWGVRKENARREVFEQSQSHVEGKRQDLIKYHHEWVNATPDNKIAIEYTIRQSFTNFDPELIKDGQLRSFLIDILNK